MSDLPDSLPIDDRLQAILDSTENPDDVYALKIVRNDLHPAARDGDFAMVSRHAALEVGKFAVLWPKAGPNKGKPVLKRLVTLPMDGWDKPAHPESEIEPVIMVETKIPDRCQVIRTELLSAIHRVVGWYSPEPGEAA
jgi:hypothetical protein